MVRSECVCLAFRMYCMPDEANKWRVLDRLNGVRVGSLRALYNAYTEHRGEFFEFTFSHGGDPIVLGVQECRESEPEILRMHAVPAIVSPAVRQSVEAAEAAMEPTSEPAAAACAR